MTEQDERVKAIRRSILVGEGSCSTIDECMTDEEIIKELDEAKIKTPDKALMWAYDREELYLEVALNHRWGEDTDPELIAYQNFKKQRGKNDRNNQPTDCR
jgi:hypothetical protein